MEKTLCVVCGKTLAASGWMGSWSIPHKSIKTSKIKDIPAYYDLFPSAPHEKFTRGFAKICGDCEERVINLFGFKSSFVPCSDFEMEQARKFVEKKLPYVANNTNFEGGENQAFLAYASQMPLKISEYRKNLPKKLSDMENKLSSAFSDYNEKCLNNIRKIKKCARFEESSGYTFGIHDGVLQYANYSEESIQLESDLHKNLVKAITKEMTSKMTFESDKFDTLYKHYTAEPLFDCIPINKIKHFKMIGSIGYSSDVSGGGGSGGGVNLSNAILGGLLFGGAGAIIGAQIGSEFHINEIKTKITKHDDRNVEFFYENENGETVSVIFDSSAYDCLMKLIPENAFDSVVTNTHKKEETPIATQPTSLSQMKELKELLDLGIITQEEFDAKKKQLLGL